MKIKQLSISTALFIAISTQASATEFVVDQKHHAANDTGQGTKKQPFKTIGAAVGRVKAGDKILIRADFISMAGDEISKIGSCKKRS